MVISLSVGLLNFLIGPDYQGPFREFMTGHLIDILLPMNVYLLGQITLRKNFSIKTSRVLAALGTIMLGVSVEWMQYLGIHILGKTYDPWDIAMYAIGIGLGMDIDIIILNSWENSLED